MSAHNIANEWFRYANNDWTVRYPDELSPNEEMVKLAINEARQVYDFCLNKTKTNNAVIEERP